ncbi:preprotein translocase subunit Sec61beta [Candidatus Woesearchaeota archaeon]|nr:MAG: preprotein translocase subunit Sec61beta [Candidatus Woesearchaeota archaeon]
MAKEQTRMPMSTAGITSFHDEYTSNIQIKPGHVLVFGIILIVISVALHVFGAQLLIQ